MPIMRPAHVHHAPKPRRLRPDLLCGLGGFALGAAALLMSAGAQGRTPPLPRGDTDILEQAHAVPAAHPPRLRG